MGLCFEFGIWTSGTPNQQLGFAPRRSGWVGPEVTQYYRFCGYQREGYINSREVFIAEQSAVPGGQLRVMGLQPGQPPSPQSHGGLVLRSQIPQLGLTAPAPGALTQPGGRPVTGSGDPCHTCVCATLWMCSCRRRFVAWRLAPDERMLPGCLSSPTVPSPRHPAGPKSGPSHSLCL